MRLPGLSEAIERDMRMAMVESVDRAVFNGDTGANENTADITGMRTAGISESTLTPEQQSQGRRTAEAVPRPSGTATTPGTLGDLHVVTSVGANTPLVWLNP